MDSALTEVTCIDTGGGGLLLAVFGGVRFSSEKTGCFGNAGCDCCWTSREVDSALSDEIFFGHFWKRWI